MAMVVSDCLSTRKNHEALQRPFVRRNRDVFRATVRPNTGTVWFNIQVTKAATYKFSGGESHWLG